MLTASAFNHPLKPTQGKGVSGQAQISFSFTATGGEPEQVSNGICFIATGSLLSCALDIAKFTYPEASVWSVPFIKPINKSQVSEICRLSQCVVTFEEHSINGGLGSLIAEISTEHSPVRILRIGVSDRYSQHCGTYEYLRKEHGLDRHSIEKQLLAFLS